MVVHLDRPPRFNNASERATLSVMRAGRNPNKKCTLATRGVPYCKSETRRTGKVLLVAGKKTNVCSRAPTSDINIVKATWQGRFCLIHHVYMAHAANTHDEFQLIRAAAQNVALWQRDSFQWRITWMLK